MTHNWASRIRTGASRSQSPMPYRLAIAHYCFAIAPRWIVGFEPTASRATILRANQLRYTHPIIGNKNVLAGIRTPDPRLRRPLLYPTELQTQSG